MAQKDKSRKSKDKRLTVGFVFGNLVAAVLLLVGGLVGLVLWLRVYTQHGVEVTIPEITGLYRVEAEALLESQELQMVIIDSTFSAKVPLGTVVDQNPRAGERAKHGREVYVIVNASCKPQVPMPDLHDLSYRQAEATLKALNINVEDVRYEPSEYRNIVLDVLINDTVVEVGQRIEDGTSVVLIVGRGKGKEKVETPELRGKSLQQTRAILLSRYLTLGAVDYDREVTEENRDSFVVYSQNPVVGEKIIEGTRVDIQMTTDIMKAIRSGLDSKEDDFF